MLLRRSEASNLGVRDVSVSAGAAAHFFRVHRQLMGSFEPQHLTAPGGSARIEPKVNKEDHDAWQLGSASVPRSHHSLAG
jgi:hypothetical protein